LKDVARVSSREQAIDILNSMEEALWLADFMVKNKDDLLSEKGRPFLDWTLNEMKNYLDIIDNKMGTTR